MKVPLIAEYVDTGDGGEIVFWSNSKLHREPAPFKPYIVVGDPRIKSEEEGRSKGYHPKLRLPTGETIWVKKLHFDTEREARLEAGRTTKNKKLLVHQMQYMDQMYIDNPEILKLHANTDDLKVLTLDIEVRTDGAFPLAKVDPIICIGVKLNDEPVVIFDNYDETNKDLQIIKDFVNYVSCKDPDIITGYNLYDFDIPYIMERCAEQNLKIGQLSRKDENGKYQQPTKGGVPYLEWKDRKKKNTSTTWKFPGRVVFDVYTQVVADQTINGLPNKKLKTIARKFQLDDVVELEEEDMSHTCKLIGTDKLRIYQESDVRITKQLFDIYFPRIASLAETVSVPLEKVAVVKELIISDIISGRKLNSLGYVSLNDNKGRYHPWYSNLFGADAVGKDWIKYQAAIVTCPKPRSWHKKIWKADFGSFYPNIMVTFNLSPETVKITELKPYTFETDFGFKRENDVMKLSIPDANFNKNIQMEIDMTRQGFMKAEEVKFMKMRKELKAKEAKAKEEGKKAEAIKLYSMQWAYKVMGNAIYGSNGQQYTRFGDLSVAIATVGLARWMILMLDSFLGSAVIEIDTDGIYCNKFPDMERFTSMLTRTIKDKFGVDSSLYLEVDEYKEAYFYLAKNYVYRDLDDSIVFHGATMKSSTHFPGYKKVLNKLAEARLRNDPEIEKLADELENFDNWELDDFIKRVRCSMSLDEYDSQGNQIIQLAKQVEKNRGTKVQIGEQIEFVDTKENLFEDVNKQMEKYIKGIIKTKPEIKKRYYTIKQLVTNKDQLYLKDYTRQLHRIRDMFNIPLPVVQEDISLVQGKLINA